MARHLLLIAVAGLLLCDVQGFLQSEQNDSEVDLTPVPPTHISYPRKKLVKMLQTAILRQLNRTEPPTVSQPLPHLSSHLMRLSLGKDQDEFKTFVLPRNKVFGCFESNRWDCSRFEFEATPGNYFIKSVQMWFHRRVPITHLSVSVYFNGTSDVQEYDEFHSEVMTENGWIGFTLQKSALEDVGDTLSCIVEVKGGPIYERGEDGPFVLVSKSPSPVRKRRRTDPPSDSTNSTCCAVDRVVNLTELKWENWVIAPAELNVRACEGSCHYDQSSFNYWYGSIMYNMAKNNLSYEKDTKKEFWRPQCFPNKMSDLKILYVSKIGELVEEDVKDIVIESCTCMAMNCHKA